MTPKRRRVVSSPRSWPKATDKARAGFPVGTGRSDVTSRWAETSRSGITPGKATDMTLQDNPHDQRMLALVRPSDWAVAPSTEVYDLIAIGGGTGGLTAASGAGLLGARTALIEQEVLGGDCLVLGCVPSKALLHAAAVAHEVRHAHEWGVHATLDRVDFGEVMAKLRSIRADIAHDDSAQVLAERQVDVLYGRAQFTGPDRLTLSGRELRFKRAVIATGARPRMPDIPGLADYAITNEQVFDLETLPERLLVIGGGPIGCELGQAFARFGARVTLVQRGDRLLPVDAPDAAEVLLESMRADGIDVRLRTDLIKVAPTEEASRPHCAPKRGKSGWRATKSWLPLGGRRAPMGSASTPRASNSSGTASSSIGGSGLRIPVSMPSATWPRARTLPTRLSLKAPHRCTRPCFVRWPERREAR